MYLIYIYIYVHYIYNHMSIYIYIYVCVDIYILMQIHANTGPVFTMFRMRRGSPTARTIIPPSSVCSGGSVLLGDVFFLYLYSSQRIHVWNIYLHWDYIFKITLGVNVGKYSSTMDP